MGKEQRNILKTIKHALGLVTVEPYLFFCLLGYTVKVVSFQSLLMDRACRNMFGYSDEVCDGIDNHEVEQARCIEAGNNLYTGVMLLGSLPAVIVAIFLGPWSDKYSRKYPLIISAGGMFLEALAQAIFTIFPSLSPIWYVVASLLSGITGGFVISVSAAFSYVSDITDERSRASRFAVLEFFNISAIVVGNLVGGQVYQLYGYLPVMSISPTSFGLGCLYVIFCLKDTKPPIPSEKRLEMLRDLVSVDNIKQSYITCSKKRPGNIRLQIWLLVWIGCCQRFTDMGTLAIGFPFARKMYRWTVTEFSNASIAFYVVNAAVTIVAMPLLSNNLKLHEAALGLIGMLSLISKMIVTALAYKEFMFYFAWMGGTLANGVAIAVRSRLSKLVQREELGRTFSLFGTCESFTPLLGSTIFLQIYNSSNRFFPGLAFAAAGVFLVPCVIIFVKSKQASPSQIWVYS
ncbi:proton-coupled folate transporter [Trichonephila inaurata madagascariensis]|uniref:Proton-coupled folate transporter n=1 Tax=Trichonephila inaurata madagascariensis TaxID=2747483 RepID=A0A8X7CBK2_9ARAC|nr:proton-coupled folate transporter [Trichonephila inaurata madagascariensis]